MSFVMRYEANKRARIKKELAKAQRPKGFFGSLEIKKPSGRVKKVEDLVRKKYYNTTNPPDRKPRLLEPRRSEAEIKREIRKKCLARDMLLLH